MIKVSVVVPVYNAEKYLRQCLDSVVGQTLRDIEIILIDDGSADGSAEICRSYLADSRVIYYRKENEGLAAARQDGMDRAGGEYIGFVDSDDWCEPDMFEKMYNAAKSNDSDIVYCNCVENEDGHRFSKQLRTGAFDRAQIEEEILPRTLAFISKKGGKEAIRWSNCLRIYKKSLLDVNGIRFDRRFRRSQDLQLTLEATLKAQNYYCLGDDYLYHNRVVGNSLSRGYTKNMWPLYVILLERLYSDVEAYGDEKLTEQMHLRAFFFVTDAIENEMKADCPNDEREKIRIVSEITKHPVCEKFAGHIPCGELNPLLQGYYSFILKKDAAGLFAFKKKYDAKEKFDRDFVRPLKHAIAEGPVTGKIFKKLKGR